MNPRRRPATLLLLTLLLLPGATSVDTPNDDRSAPRPAPLAVKLTVTSELTLPNVPMDPTIDFDRLLREADLPGRLDPNSIEVVDLHTGRPIPHALNADFGHGDRGRVEWVIENPTHTSYEIRFKTSAHRPPLRPAGRTPMIGTGDLLRYNAGQPRSIASSYLSRLIDLTGDGKRDLVGCWNYAYRPGEPWDGIFCYPRVGQADTFAFGDPVRLRYVDRPDSNDFKHFSKIYMHADLADLDRDGRVDLVYSPSGGSTLYLYLNTGRRDAGGMPVFTAAGSIPRGTNAFGPVRAVDLDGDGAIDFVVDRTFVANRNPDGWPIQPAEATRLDVGASPCFFDVDDDGRLDGVCLIDHDPKTVARDGVRGYTVGWQRNLGGDPPRFGPGEPLAGMRSIRGVGSGSTLAAVNHGPRRGILVNHDFYARIAFYERVGGPGATPRFQRAGRAKSLSAVMSLSDQAWPCLCDWDDDGDWDLLVGGGYGWCQIVINDGTNREPAFREAEILEADGKPIRIVMNDEFGVPDYGHNMGYTYPVFVDWDGDERPDLMLPNITNRIYWYANVGTRQAPQFGPRRQLIVDGYPDSPEARAQTAELLMTKGEGQRQKGRPFFWRTGAAFADFNGDGLTDLITHHGETRVATLFVQYRDGDNALRLKEQGPVARADGRPLDDSIVHRKSHWTESFRAADWDGDGLLDLFYACAGAHGGIMDGASIFLLRNVGRRTEPTFGPPRPLRCFGKPIRITNHGPNPWIADVDDDGLPDLLACVEWSVYPFYRHAAIEMTQRPTFEITAVRR